MRRGKKMRSVDDAVALWKSGQVEDAVHEFDALAEASTDADKKCALLINVVRCYADLGRLTDAERTLGQIRALAPDDYVVRFIVDFGAACVAAQGGQHEKALALFDGILKEYGELLRTSEYRDYYEETQCRRAFCLVHLKRYGHAITILREADSFNALKAEIQQEAHVYLGLCYAQLGERRPAKEQFQRAIEYGFKNDSEAQARYNLGVIYFLDGGFAQAKYQLETVLQDNPQGMIPNVPRKDVYQQLSRVSHYRGDKENAKRYAKLVKESSK